MENGITFDEFMEKRFPLVPKEGLIPQMTYTDLKLFWRAALAYGKEIEGFTFALADFPDNVRSGIFRGTKDEGN